MKLSYKIPFFFLLSLATKTMSHASNDENARGIKAVKEAKKKSKKAQTSADIMKKELEECRAELDAPTYLVVQKGNQCTLSRDETGKYYLAIAECGEKTWFFSDRPARLEAEMDTNTFYDRFDFFFPVNDRPNAALTFVHEDSDKFCGPIVAIIEEVIRSDGIPTVMLALGQSQEQASSSPLSAFFDDVADGTSAQETYRDCSFFIDNMNIGEYTVHCTCENIHTGSGDSGVGGANYWCTSNEIFSANIDYEEDCPSGTTCQTEGNHEVCGGVWTWSWCDSGPGSKDAIGHQVCS